jgi:alkanesulfonate monooxygenase SsuD/methylene tetrahydromethanopterin reductase-like flavin-dependent oxidoreductase (luciferase family)
VGGFSGWASGLSPINFAYAAIAARTKRIRMASGVILMPFHNPVRLAKDMAVVDVISGGRLELGLGVGYKVEEFESFGVPFKERGARTNEALGIVRRLLDGETVTLKNKFFNLSNVKIPIFDEVVLRQPNVIKSVVLPQTI